jgi:hypothetical protein
MTGSKTALRFPLVLLNRKNCKFAAIRPDGWFWETMFCLYSVFYPAKPASTENAREVSVLQVTSDATAKGSLTDNALLAALQEDAKALIKPIVPAHETGGIEVQLVSGGGSNPRTRGQGGAEAGPCGPALSRVCDL